MQIDFKTIYWFIKVIDDDIDNMYWGKETYEKGDRIMTMLRRARNQLRNTHPF